MRCCILCPYSSYVKNSFAFVFFPLFYSLVFVRCVCVCKSLCLLELLIYKSVSDWEAAGSLKSLCKCRWWLKSFISGASYPTCQQLHRKLSSSHEGLASSGANFGRCHVTMASYMSFLTLVTLMNALSSWVSLLPPVKIASIPRNNYKLSPSLGHGAFTFFLCPLRLCSLRG